MIPSPIQQRPIPVIRSLVIAVSAFATTILVLAGQNATLIT